jgi:hypothetical protein
MLETFWKENTMFTVAGRAVGKRVAMRIGKKTCPQHVPCEKMLRCCSILHRRRNDRKENVAVDWF